MQCNAAQYTTGSDGVRPGGPSLARERDRDYVTGEGTQGDTGTLCHKCMCPNGEEASLLKGTLLPKFN